MKISKQQRVILIVAVLAVGAYLAYRWYENREASQSTSTSTSNGSTGSALGTNLDSADLSGAVTGADSGLNYSAGTYDIMVSQPTTSTSSGTGTSTSTSTTTGTGTTTAPAPVMVKVPPLSKGENAGQMHNAIVAAGLVPAAAAGQQADWVVKSIAPASGTSVPKGTKVIINATGK